MPSIFLRLVRTFCRLFALSLATWQLRPHQKPLKLRHRKPTVLPANDSSCRRTEQTASGVRAHMLNISRAFSVTTPCLRIMESTGDPVASLPASDEWESVTHRSHCSVRWSRAASRRFIRLQPCRLRRRCSTRRGWPVTVAL